MRAIIKAFSKQFEVPAFRGAPRFCIFVDRIVWRSKRARIASFLYAAPTLGMGALQELQQTHTTIHGKCFLNDHDVQTLKPAHWQHRTRRKGPRLVHRSSCMIQRRAKCMLFAFPSLKRGRRHIRSHHHGHKIYKHHVIVPGRTAMGPIVT